MKLPIFFIFSHLISASYANLAFDYCVGDLSLPRGPSGYSCKDPATVSVDDFVYTEALGVKGDTSNMFKFGASSATVAQFPGLNGMSISLVRADLEVGGAVPIHSHRVPELVILVEGTVVAGFIDSNNTAYYKTLSKGDTMILPSSLLHFMVNVGSTPVLMYASFPSENPGVQILDSALFRSNLPLKLIEKVTLINHSQVAKLKKAFGGTY